MEQKWIMRYVSIEPEKLKISCKYICMVLKLPTWAY